MFSLLDPLHRNTYNGSYDYKSGSDMLAHQFASHLQTTLAHTRAVVPLRHFFLSFAAFLLGVWLLLRLSPHTLVRSPARVAQARKILQALLTIITPTQSVWPRQYVNLAYRAAATKETTVYLPLQTLYEDVVKQRIEFRNPKVHLPLLFQGVLATHLDVNMSFTLNVGTRWRGMMDKCRKGPSSCSSYASRYASTSTQGTQIGQDQGAVVLGPGFSPCCSLFLHIFHQDIPSVSLDCISAEGLCAYIEELKATLAPGTCLMLGLTTISSAATQHQAHLATLPFLPRKAKLSPGCNSARARLDPIQRPSTPLNTSITQVIDLLKTGSIAVTVEVAQNVSREYAEFMYGYVDGLEQDVDVRAQFVHEWGMEAWVEERLCTVWEAALVEVGLLEAWTIVVCKPE